MKNLVLIIALILPLAGFLVGCDTGTSKVEKAKEKVEEEKKDVVEAQKELEEAERDSLTTYQEFKKKAEEQIEENQKTITELKNKAKMEKKNLEEKYRREVDTLEKRN